MTALPTLRLAVKPILTDMLSTSGGHEAACSIRPGRTARRPEAATRRKSGRVFSLTRVRGVAASPAGCGAPPTPRGPGGGAPNQEKREQADRRVRPLAPRAAGARPPPGGG